MAGTSVKKPVPVIDLTLDSDDDNKDDAPLGSRGPPAIRNGPNQANTLLPSLHVRTNSQWHPHVPAPPSYSPRLPPTAATQHQADDGPPAKRARVHDAPGTSETAYDITRRFARAGASQAAKDDSRVKESVLKEKLHGALLAQFGNRIEQQLHQSGTVLDSVRGEILAVRKGLLKQLLTLPDCYKPIALASASTFASAPAPVAGSSGTRPLNWMPLTTSQANGDGVQSRSCLAAASSSVQMDPRPPVATTPTALIPTTPAGLAPSRRTAFLTNGARGELASSYNALPQAPATSRKALQIPGAAEVRLPLVPITQLSQTHLAEASTTVQRPVSRDTAREHGPVSTPRQPHRRNVPSTPSSAREARTNVNAPTTPQNFHARAKNARWTCDISNRVETKPTSYFALDRRPYVGIKGKEAMLRANGQLRRLQPNLLQKSEVFHVDFDLTEVKEVYKAARKALKKSERATNDHPYRDLEKLIRRLRDPERNLALLARQISPELPAREEDDIFAFLNDVWNRRVLPQEQQILSVEKDSFDTRGEDLQHGRLTSLLLARDLSGSRYGGTRRPENFTNEFRQLVESGLQIRSEFTNCAGDVSTVSWISDQIYIAGTTAHMDSHNQQYNKPGNLVLGAVSRGNATLKAYPDHRIIRPIIEKGDNSSAAMRETQEPYIYTSVVFSDYDPIHERAYTSSFDNTVKIWKVDEAKASMRCIGTWEHEGPVNFVQASLLQNRLVGLVATAADVPSDAVRIYEVPKNDDELATSRFVSFSCSRMNDDAPFATDKWTYCPSTMKWGIEASVRQYLLVGYSPRSRTGDDGDIPAESINTGEICLWDASTGDRIPITSANKQNVFEVLWHPSQPYFIAATSPKGAELKENRARTQIRIFRRIVVQGEGICFSEWKALDCMAADINELTIMPNSVIYCYVTAGCTDGNTYVWDTALGDKPIHVLSHGPPLEGIRINDAEDDTGVKFTAWGLSGKLFSGSSDGVVRVWNVRSGAGQTEGKVILEASAQISSGAFSPDRSKLIIGDASGRVFVLSVDEDDGKPPTFITLPNGIKKRMPTEIEHHAAPPPPPEAKKTSGIGAARDFLAARQLRHTGDPTIGVVQDVNYASTGFFCKEFHFNHDPTQELFAQYFAKQQDDAKLYTNASPRIKRLRRLIYSSGDVDELVDPDNSHQALLSRHEENCKLDLTFEKLSLEIRDVLSSGGIGQRELLEGLDYPEIMEDDEAELKKGRFDIP